MTNLWPILLISVALGMDAFSVALGIGAARHRVSLRAILRLSASFGLFQFFMPIAGWLGGMTIAAYIDSYDHWIAFAVLLYVGGKMIHQSFRGEEAPAPGQDPTRGITLIMLSVATSIDALAVGLSMAVMKTPILCPSAVIGIVAFVMTAVGMLFGERLGKMFGRRVEALGGLILIGIGLKILWDGLA